MITRLCILLAIAFPLLAQPGYRKHNLIFDLAAGLPRADLQPFFDASPGFGARYGYRFHRNFQVETGLETLFGAAGIRDFYESEFGPLRIRDYQFLVPFGGRVILPLKRDRFQLFGGGGGAYMRYSEMLKQPFRDSYIRVSCPVCQARSGWGYYALAGTSIALDRRQHFRLGFSAKMYRGNTAGDEFGFVPAIRTYDNWLVLSGGFGFSF